VNAESARHVLVVDDDRLVLASLSRGLRQAGYRVSEAASALDALALIERTVPDLALLDVRMPGTDGIELGRLLREQAAVPFLYLSAYGQADIVAQAAAHGALGYLVKPLDIAQILPAIETALTRAAEMAKLRDREGQLESALASSRDVSVAIGVLMERNRIDREAAFEALRARARSERCTVAALAQQIIEASEKLNVLNNLAVKPRPRR
jgi:AmiR/NasT family two-component response regulator